MKELTKQQKINVLKNSIKELNESDKAFNYLCPLIDRYIAIELNYKYESGKITETEIQFPEFIKSRPKTTASIITWYDSFNKIIRIKHLEKLLNEI